MRGVRHRSRFRCRELSRVLRTIPNDPNSNAGHVVDLDDSGLHAEASALSSAGAPRTFVPYGVGYVELPGQVSVESRLTEHDPSRARVSAWRWNWSSMPFSIDDDGNEVVSVRIPARDE